MPKKAALPPTATNALTLSQLKSIPNINYRLQVLLYDLAHISKDLRSQHRLAMTTHPLYISPPYFTEPQAAQVLSTTLDPLNYPTDTSLTSLPPPQQHQPLNSTIEEALHAHLSTFLDKRRASGDARPCGPHDMLPVYLSVFQLEKHDLEDEKLLSRIRRSGLESAGAETGVTGSEGGDGGERGAQRGKQKGAKAGR